MRTQICILALVVAGFIFAGPRAARADYIDFTDTEFSAGDYQTSFDVTTWAGDLRFTPSGDNAASLYWDEFDGFGVRSAYEHDEIEADETLRLSFLSGPVYLDSVSLTDLFYEGGYFESGSYQLNGAGDWIPFAQDDLSTLPKISNGEYHVPVYSPGVTSITFKAPGYQYLDGRHQDHEYSVAGVDLYVPVPEPSTLALVGLGLVANAVAVRRRRSRFAATRSAKTL